MRLLLQSSAEDDILRQIEWYAEQGLPGTARCFYFDIANTIDALVAMPLAGIPQHLNNPQLVGLRRWPVTGFDEFWIYYLAQPELVTILRILHSKRDIGVILEKQAVEDPRPP